MATAAADIFVDEALVRRLLLEQHPDLCERDLRFFANGWDNYLYRLGDDLVVRLPRRSVAAQLIGNEQRWLPQIAARVAVAVPAPVGVGEASDTFPWPWSITPWFEGSIASDTPFYSADRVARELAAFVRALHSPAPTDAPVNPFRGVRLAQRDTAMRSYLATGLVPRAVDVQGAWQFALAATPWTDPPVWLHGDLHPANILINEGHLAAVLDFGDLTSGDPAADLATAWLTFDRDARERFFAELAYDEDTWRRAAGWALLLSAAFLANPTDSPTMRDIGVHGIEQVLRQGFSQ